MQQWEQEGDLKGVGKRRHYTPLLIQLVSCAILCIYMPGPKPNTEKDLKVLALRAENMKFRDIGNHPDINEDVKNVHLRYKRALKLVGKLSPVETK